MKKINNHSSRSSIGLLACRVIVLEDNDILHLARGSYNIYNQQQDDPSARVSSVARALSKLDLEVSSSQAMLCTVPIHVTYSCA